MFFSNLRLGDTFVVGDKDSVYRENSKPEELYKGKLYVLMRDSNGDYYGRNIIGGGSPEHLYLRYYNKVTKVIIRGVDYEV